MKDLVSYIVMLIFDFVAVHFPLLLNRNGIRMSFLTPLMVIDFNNQKIYRNPNCICQRDTRSGLIVNVRRAVGSNW